MSALDGKRRRAQSNKRVAIAVVCVAATVVLFLVGLFLLHTWEEGYSRAPLPEGGDSEAGLTYYDGAWYRQRRDVETTLLMGIDKAAVDETMPSQGEYEQSDFMMLLVIDKKTEKCVAIHINRDTMTEIQMLSDTGRVEGRFTGQITLAHSYGGQPEIQCRNAVTAVSNLMYGIKVDHYISLAMDGVLVLNDLVGGVTVEVMDDFTGFDDTLVQGEAVTLMGQHALNYVRIRKGLEDPSNIHRMERQKQYLEALQTKLISAADADQDFSMSALMELNEYMVSNCSVEQLSKLSDTLKEYGIAEYRTLEGEAVMGKKFIEYYVNEGELQKTVMELFYEQVRED